LAGFQVTTIGRFWVTAEDPHREIRPLHMRCADFRLIRAADDDLAYYVHQFSWRVRALAD
jgi:hypothetical protein